MIFTGDYAVKAQIGKKSIAGTIPSELGKLKAWKYPVFGKSYVD